MPSLLRSTETMLLRPPTCSTSVMKLAKQRKRNLSCLQRYDAVSNHPYYNMTCSGSLSLMR